MSDAPDTASSASPTLVIEALPQTIAWLERMLSTLSARQPCTATTSDW